MDFFRNPFEPDGIGQGHRSAVKRSQWLCQFYVRRTVFSPGMSCPVIKVSALVSFPCRARDGRRQATMTVGQHTVRVGKSTPVPTWSCPQAGVHSYAAYMSQTRDQQRFTISEVAADWHEPMVPARIMWPSFARANGQLDPRRS